MYATYCMKISLYDNHLHMCCVHGDGMHILIASQIGPYFSYFMCVCVCVCMQMCELSMLMFDGGSLCIFQIVIPATPSGSQQ